MKKWMLSLKMIVLCFALMACGKTASGLPTIQGVEGPHFNIVDGKVLITLKLLNISTQVGAQMFIPETSHSTVEVGPNIVDGGTLVQIALDPADIKGVQIAQDPNALPDGRPIPGIPGGELPSLRVDTKLFNSSYYFSKTLFGVYLPFNFNTQGLGASYEFNINGKATGNIGIVASEQGKKNSGLLIFLRKAALEDSSLKSVLKMSARNPGVVY